MGLTRADIGSYARSITMVEVPAANFVPEAANPEIVRVGAMCITCQSRKKEVMMIMLSFPHSPLRCEKQPFSYSLLGPVCGIRVRLNEGMEFL